MRVIAGTAGGRTLQGPRTTGRSRGAAGLIRPTSDLSRGALFSMLDSLMVPPVRVLDLFAGTGALGIEALSRGAQHACLVDQAREAIDLVRRNLDTTGMADRAQLVHAALPAGLDRLAPPYDLILLDPPYGWDGTLPLLARLAKDGWLTVDGALVAEHSPRLALPDSLDGLERVRARRHGDTMLSIFMTAEPA